MLPGNAYALAFVRTYASALGLDAEEMVRRFRAEAAEFGRRTELVFPIPMPERGFPAGAVLLLGLVLASAPMPAGIGCPVRAPARRNGHRDPGAPGAAGRTGTAARVHRVVAATPRSDRRAPLRRQTSCHRLRAGGHPAPPAADLPTSAALLSSAPLPMLRSGAELAPAPPAPPPDASRIVLRASADAWVLVKDHSGTVLLNRMLKAGETWPVPPGTDLLLTTGNAGGTEIAGGRRADPQPRADRARSAATCRSTPT